MCQKLDLHSSSFIAYLYYIFLLFPLLFFFALSPFIFVFQFLLHFPPFFYLVSYCLSLVFPFCLPLFVFVSVFSTPAGSLAYPDLLGTKRLSCCCCHLGVLFPKFPKIFRKKFVKSCHFIPTTFPTIG
jgi:hypothetical protein